MEKLLYFVFAITFMIVVNIVKHYKEIWEYYNIKFEDKNSEMWHKIMVSVTVVNMLLSCIMIMILILTK